MKSEPLVSYSRWRAVVAVAFPLLVIAIPAFNLVVNPADFHHRWIENWVSSIGFSIAVIWLIYVVCPGAFRLLGGGPEEVWIDAGVLIFQPGERFNLRDLSAIEILRPWLKHPRVSLQFGPYWAVVETAFQTLGERKSVESIAESIAAAARAEAERASA